MSTLKVGTIQDHQNSNTAISIDSSGRILTPARPAFRAYASGNFDQANWQLSGGVPPIVVFPTKSYDIGGNYNTGNGKFTVPLTGLYHFDVNLYVSGMDNSANWIATYIHVSGAQASRTIVDQQGGNYGAPWLSDNLQLTAGQEVSVHLGIENDSDITLHGDAGGSITHFSGYLIG